MLLLLLSALQVPTWGQWQRQYPLAKLENVLDIDINAEGFGVAVGPDGMVLMKNATSDEWHIRPEPGADWRLEACDYADGLLGTYMAVGGPGLALSQDAGSSWWQVPDSPTGIKAVKIIAPEDVIVIAQAGVFRYHNSMWENLNLPVASNVTDGDILDDQHIWCFTGGGSPVMYATSDGGASWSMNTDVPDPDVVRFYDAQFGVASDTRKVYNSMDGGLSWTLVSDGEIHTSATDIAFGLSPGVLMAATFNGDPSFSIDSGATWERLDLGAYNFQRNYSTAAISDEEFWIGSDVSSISQTENAGATWTERSGPNRGTIHDMHFVNRDKGFAVGSQGQFLRTYNSGTQWENLSFNPTTNYFCIAERNNGLWMGGNQQILYSEDDGTTWTEKGSFLGSVINDVLPLSDEVILACSATGIVYRSGDAGITWDTVFEVIGQWRNLARIDDQRVLAMGQNGIIRTSDQGLTWNVATIPEAGLTYEQAHFIGEEGWMVTSSFKRTMWHTTNAGNSWTPLNLPVDRNWEGVYFITPDTGVVVGRNSTTEGRAYITYSGGQTWSAAYTTSFGLYGVTGVPNPNGTAWIHGLASDIEVLPTCTIFPVLSEFTGNLSPCEKDTVQYSVTAQDAEQFLWFFPPGWQPVGSTDNDTVTVIAGQNPGNISVAASNTCGLSNNLTLAATPNLLPAATALEGDLTPCLGSVVTYSVTATAVDSFAWGFPGDWELVSDEQAPEIQVIVGSLAGPVAVTGSNGCGTSAPVEWLAVPADSPNVLAFAGDTTPCPGDTVIYTFEFEGVDFFSYSNPGGWELINSTATSIEVVPTSAGTFLVVGLNDCGAAELEINVTPEVVPDIAIINTANVLSLTEDGVTYQWYLNGAAIPNATGATFTPAVSGQYTCEVGFASGCDALTPPVDVVITAVDNPAVSRGLSIYPSPAQSDIMIRDLNERCAYTIRDMSGRVVSSGQRANERIDISRLSAGVYMLQIDLPEGKGYLRFMKE